MFPLQGTPGASFKISYPTKLTISQIWFRIRVLVECSSRGQQTPWVDVHFVPQAPSDPPICTRIGIVLERELMSGLRREIMRSLQGRRFVSFPKLHLAFSYSSWSSDLIALIASLNSYS